MRKEGQHFTASGLPPKNVAMCLDDLERFELVLSPKDDQLFAQLAQVDLDATAQFFLETREHPARQVRAI